MIDEKIMYTLKKWNNEKVKEYNYMMQCNNEKFDIRQYIDYYGRLIAES